MMEITYKLTRKDIILFSLHQLSRTPIMLIMVIGIWLHISYKQYKAVVASGDSIFSQCFIFIGMQLYFIVILLAILAILFSLTLLSKKKNKAHFSQRKMTFQDEGIISETEDTKSELKWSAIQKIWQTKKYIFLNISQRAAIVIPKRIFEDKNSANTFYKFIVEKWQARELPA